MDSFEAFVVYAEEGLYALNRNVPRHEDYVEDVSLRHTGWYSEPRAALYSMIATLFLYVPLFLLSFRSKNWKPRVGFRGFKSSWFLLLERAQLWLLSGVFCMTIYYKTMAKYGGGAAFLGMPCHLITMATLLLGYFGSPDSEWSRRTFFIILSHGWAVLMAILFPDLKPLVHDFEIPHFFFYHIVCFTLPLTWLLSGKYVYYEGLWPSVVASVAINASISGIPVQLLSILANANVGYMMTPPPVMVKAFPKEVLEPYFRFIFGLFCLPGFTLIYRSFLMEPFSYLLMYLAPADKAETSKRVVTPSSSPVSAASSSPSENEKKKR